MSTLTRQNTLFVAEDWFRIYEALENVDFRAYDFDNLVQALFQYLRSNYGEQFNDWVASSEFVAKVEILAWLSQNIAFRVDLNSRENFLATAERRDSLIRLAQNIGYRINRVRSANGFLKLKTIRTTQNITDSNGVNLRNKTIIWNDPRDEDWFERFILILNASFITRTKFGFPLTTATADGGRVDQYVFNSSAPVSGSYRFSANTNGVRLPFDIYNARLNEENGLINELAPSSNNAFNIFYFLDGRGFGSDRTGFFLPFKQGNLSFQDEQFPARVPIRTVDLSVSNINNDDFFVQELDANGGIISNWTQVDTTFGEGVTFNTLSGLTQNVYELDTLMNDTVRIRFGDGSFGRMPVGRFRFWYRTANPTPVQIKSSAIQNQVVTIPYVSSGDLHQLTMTYSLENSVSNGVSSESNFDIRTRVGKVFYTQNRMVTAQDYNNFYLKDNSVKKVKTINRSFTGQSRFSRLTDPTGLYQNVKHVAEDGRIYQDVTRTVDIYSADPDVISVENLINTVIRPILRKEDKRILYFNAYSEIILTTPYTWNQTVEVGGQSQGNILLSGLPQTVGNAAVAPLVYVDTDSIIRFSSPLGRAITVDRVIETGTAPSGIILKDVVASGTALFSVFPALRNRFTTSEEIELENRLEQRLDFALSWNQTTQTWNVIQSDNIDYTSSFSLVNQGSLTGTGLDASWMILFEFTPNNPSDTWTITDRGRSLFFESAREIDFIFSNIEPVIDPETGRVARDSIVLLESNESRDSLRRRGLDSLALGACEFLAYEFEGDGLQRCYRTQQVPLLAEGTVVLINEVLQVNGSDYTIVPDIQGYEVCFTNPPPLGAQIEIYFSSRFVNATQSIARITGNGIAEEWPMGASGVHVGNTILFLDGIQQYGNLDFGIATLVGSPTNSGLVFSPPLASGVRATAYFMHGIDNELLGRRNTLGDGTTVTWTIPALNQSLNTLLVAIDGVTQDRNGYTVASTATESTVTFTTAPPVGTRLRFIWPINPVQTRTNTYRFAADGVNNSFILNNNISVPPAATGMMVFIDGVLQDGPGSVVPEWRITGTNTLFFTAPPPANTVVMVYYIAGAMGVDCSTDTSSVIIEPGPLPPLTVESCLLSFLGEPVEFTPFDVIRHADGYVNKNGLSIAPVDGDFDGVYDAPFIFKDLVIQDGRTDLVLWRKIQEFGFSIWDPINQTTLPRGTYGSSAGEGIALNDSYDVDLVAAGSIHYDTFTATWLVADGITETWKLATDQSAYRVLIGRDHLRFIWTHYAPEANRIDPSKSNIMNVYILTAGYDTAFRAWLDQNGAEVDRPQPERTEQLRLSYMEFEEFTPLSDSVIYYPARYKPLFGNQAVPELRSVFKIIQSPGSQLSESDLKLRVLNAVRAYFDVTRWEFGEKFFFTELVAFVHAQLAPDLQSMVIVPRNNNQAFGRMFQVRAEPDELFVSAAAPTDIEIVPFFTDEEIRVGSLI
jgi:hypothetical protein